MAMFFIGRGDCSVSIRDEKGHKEDSRILDEGEHFGEISLIYRCSRSATVVSRNYNTLAKLDYQNFTSLMIEYPEYEKLLKNYILTTYNDSKTKFMK